jgi:hypothetical protein
MKNHDPTESLRPGERGQREAAAETSGGHLNLAVTEIAGGGGTIRPQSSVVRRVNPVAGAFWFRGSRRELVGGNLSRNWILKTRLISVSQCLGGKKIADLPLQSQYKPNFTPKRPPTPERGP